MRETNRAASHFIVGLATRRAGRDMDNLQRNNFSRALQHEINHLMDSQIAPYQSHQTIHKTDPHMMAAVQKSGIHGDLWNKIIPDEFLMWITNEHVSYKMEHQGTTYRLYDGNRHSLATAPGIYQYKEVLLVKELDAASNLMCYMIKDKAREWLGEGDMIDLKTTMEEQLRRYLWGHWFTGLQDPGDKWKQISVEQNMEL
jgi:hypothetical protein